MKKFFKKIAFVSAMAMVVSAMPAQSAAAAEGPQMYKSLKFYLGGDVTGTYSDEARYAKVWNKDGYTVEFDIDNENVATVSKKGKVTPVGVGTATVTATFENEDGDVVEKACVVTVKKNAVKVGISDNSAAALQNLTVGDTFQTKTYRTDADGVTTWKGKDVITDSARFTSSNTDVFTVTKKGGYVKAVGVGEATLSVWAVQSEKAQKDANGKVVEYKATTDKEEYKVVVKAAAMDVTATGVKEITVNGSFAKDATFTVKKGYSNIAATATVAADGKSAVLALATKLTKGTYTVTCGDSSADITVDDEYVASIVVLDDGNIVTTDPNAQNIYVHYDVFNQYNESVRKSFSVTWTASTASGNAIQDNKTLGILTIPKNTAAGNTDKFNYGDTVVLTGVHTSAANAKNVTATVKVGLVNCVSEVEFLGVTKENSGTLMTTLPVGFTDNDYLLVYKAYDRMGYEMEFKDVDTADLIFTSLSPMLIGSTFTDVENGVIIDGEQYGAVRLTRGIQAGKGGVANIQVTSNKTGITKAHTLELVAEQVLSTFRLITPDVVIAEGDSDYNGYTVNIPYEAYDQDGNPVTSFRVLHGAVTLTCGNDDSIMIYEANDGSAYIQYTVPSNANATKNADAIRMLSSVVINTGSSSNISLMIKDAAVPTTVKAFGADVPANLIEGNFVTIAATGKAGLVYYDQYDREMTHEKAAGTIGNRFVAVKSTSDAFDITAGDWHALATGLAGLENVSGYVFFKNGADNGVTFTAKRDIKTIKTELFEFAIVSFDELLDKYVVDAGSAKKLSLSAVDISQIRNFTVGTYSNGHTGNNGDATIAYYDSSVEDNKSYAMGIWAGGSMANGAWVNVTNEYLNVTVVPEADGTEKATKVWDYAFRPVNFTDDSEAILPDNPSDFLDYSQKQSNGQYVEKMSKFKLAVEIKTIVASGEAENVEYVQGAIVTTLNQEIKVNNDAVKCAEFVTKGDNVTINASYGVITSLNLVQNALHAWNDNYGSQHCVCSWKGVGMDGIEVTISKLEESANGLYFGSQANEKDQKPLTLKANKTKLDEVMIENAEIGDTFVVTFMLDGVEKSVNVTVGADSSAHFNSANTSLTWR